MFFRKQDSMVLIVIICIKIGEHILFRNDAASQHNERPYGGTAVYTRIDYYPGYPYRCNQNDIEITVMRFMIIPLITS